jgi:CRP-like cAMP-binding protein
VSPKGNCDWRPSEEALDAAYRERLLATHLRLVPALCQLRSEALHWLTQRAQLITADPGAVVCDEYEPADALYLVRGGMVEMVRDQSALLHPREVSDWSALCRGLLAGADSHRNT